MGLGNLVDRVVTKAALRRVKKVQDKYLRELHEDGWEIDPDTGMARIRADDDPDEGTIREGYWHV